MEADIHSSGVQHNIELGQQRQKLLRVILALSSGLFTVTLTLVDSLLLMMENHVSVSNGRPYIHFLHSTSTSFKSRKRKRNAHAEFHTLWFHLSDLRSYLIRKREIYFPWYIKPRTIQWFYLYLDWVPFEDPERFKDFFCISPDTFDHICEMVQDDMITNPPLCFCLLPNRKLSVKRHVAIALRRLSTGDQYLGISELFGLSKVSVIKVTMKFIEAFNKRGRDLIHWPRGNEMDKVKQGFNERLGFPNCCGAVDGTHFPVELPSREQSQDYFDFKHKISVSMQGVADLSLSFLHVVAGWPGSIQDTRLMRVSSFYRDVEYNKTKLSSFEYFCYDNATVLREYILGNAGYPLYPWLMVPYPRGVSIERDDWNHFHSQARMCIERAFGRLKLTWQILSRILWRPRREKIGPMIYCCCLLHNLMIGRKEAFNVELLRGISAHPHGYGGVNVKCARVEKKQEKIF